MKTMNELLVNALGEVMPVGVDFLEAKIKDHFEQRFAIAICESIKKPYGPEDLGELLKKCFS